MYDVPWNLIGLALLAALTAIYVLCVNRDIDHELCDWYDDRAQLKADLERIEHPSSRPRSLR